MDDLIAAVVAKKAELDRLRARGPGRTANFDHVADLELTWSSNAIEGNTLTAVETTMVVEQGLTIAGRPLKDHMEAIDHFEAIGFVRGLARSGAPLTEMSMRSLHRLVMLRSAPEIAGRYAQQGRYVLTDAGRHAFPSPSEIPALMGGFAAWLRGAPDDPPTAFAAHRRMADIHPFDDGNGRTARLLMNLVLLRGGYPPVSVRPADRPAYIAALQESPDAGAFDRLLYERLDASLGGHIAATRDNIPPTTPAGS